MSADEDEDPDVDAWLLERERAADDVLDADDQEGIHR